MATGILQEFVQGRNYGGVAWYEPSVPRGDPEEAAQFSDVGRCRELNNGSYFIGIGA